MKTAFIGFLIGIASLAAVERGFRAYQWKHNADKRGFYAEAAGAYLFGPSGVVVRETGDELNRQQLFDHLLHAAVEKTPALAFKK